MFAKKLNNHHYVFNLRTRRSGYKALTEGLRNVQLVALSAKTPIPQEGDSVFYCGHIDWFTVESVTHFETFSELMESDLFYYLIPNALSENAIKLLEEKADNPRITAGIFALELRYDPEAYDLDEEDFGFSELTIIN